MNVSAEVGYVYN